MKNSYALVTGATSGIGLEISRDLAKRGYNLILVSRTTEKLDQTSKELIKKFNIKCDYFSSDLTEVNAPDNIYDFTKSNKYNIDILINNANVFTFGVFQGTIDLNPDAATQYVTSNGDYDIFMQRFTDATLSSTSFSAVDFQIYPNPTSSILNINTDLNNFNYSIYSIDGKIVRQGNSQINQTSIDVSSLISGIYMLDVLTENNERSIQKFIKK